MIYGIGCDIVKVSRFKKWLENEKILNRFFSDKEICKKNNISFARLCEHYAARFAAKEAFVKALGTGFSSFKLKEIYVQTDKNGKPELKLEGNVKSFFEKMLGKKSKIHISLSHEKEYAISYVIIETDS